MVRSLICLSALLLAAGCSKQKPAPKTPVAAADPAPAASSTTAASDTLGVSDDLARQCELSFGDVAQTPKFDLDRDELAPADRDVLQRVATCLTTGPLKDRKLALVGRADPRGTTEYNMGLGARRAQAVLDYLRRLGVPPARMALNTRGAIDAQGHDEDSWQLDRRVDLGLAN